MLTAGLAAISQEFPDWHAWRSSAGRYWATRRGNASPDGHGSDWCMTIDADDEDGLRDALRQQELLTGQSSIGKETAVIERVRAVLVTESGKALLIKRIRPGMHPYWVLPGGHVDPDDPSLEAALSREIREELAGEPEVLSLLHIHQSEDERQLFYLGRIRRWSFADRTGLEFREDGRGEYVLEEVPLTLDALGTIDLKPDQIAAFLRSAIERGDLWTLPDLRE